MLTESFAGELRQLEARALTLADEFNATATSLSEVRARAETLRRSHSNSFFGDHALTYYRDFEAPTHGFDVEWGHLSGFGGKHNPDWIVYSLDALIRYAYGDSNNEIVEARNQELDLKAKELRDRTLDLLALIKEDASGSFLRVVDDVVKHVSDAFEKSTAQKHAMRALNSAPRMTRDSSNISQGLRTPVHVAALAQVHFVTETGRALSAIANCVRRLQLARIRLRACRRGTRCPEGKQATSRE